MKNRPTTERGVLVNARKLKALRYKKGWSQEALADKAKVNTKSVYRPEKNIRISHASATAIASALGITFEELCEPDALPYNNLPVPPNDFSGRESELAAMKAAINEAVIKKGVPIIHIHGMAGVGKSVLASKLAEEMKTMYSHAQFLLDMRAEREPLSDTDAMRRIIRIFDPTYEPPEGEEKDFKDELIGDYRGTLSDKKAILLLDNVAEAEQIEHLIPASNCLLITTSRQKFALAGGFEIELKGLPPKEAQTFLLSKYRMTRREANRIAELCDFLPFALRYAAHTLAQTSALSAGEYADRLQDERQKRLEHVPPTLKLHYDLLDETIQSHWRALSVFPGTFDYLAAASVWVAEPGEAKDLLGMCYRYNLVEYIRALGRYRLHNLARDFAYDQMNEAERYEYKKRHANHYSSILAQANSIYRHGGEHSRKGLEIFDREWGNFRAAQEWASSQADNDLDAALICVKYPEEGNYLLDLHRKPLERLVWLQPALAVAQRLGMRQSEGHILRNIGRVYNTLGEPFSADGYYKKALNIFSDLKDDHGKGTTLRNLGCAYMDRGETGRALEIFKEALKLLRATDYRHGQANVLRNLGKAYAELGQPRRAIDAYQQALNIYRSPGVLYDRGEANALRNLGMAYAALGQLQQAIKYYEDALMIHHKIRYRRGEANVLANLGSEYRKLGYARDAIKYCDKALDIFREIGDRRSEGITIGTKGNAYHHLGQLRQAMNLYKESLEISRQVGDSRNESVALGRIGAVYRELEDYEKANEFIWTALDICGEDLRGKSNQLGRLGMLYADLWVKRGDRGNLEQALKQFESRLKLAKQVDDRRGEGITMGNIGSVHYAFGDIPLAISYHMKDYEIAKEVGDLRGQSIAAGNLGADYAAMNNFDEALRFHKEHLTISRKIKNPRCEADALFKMSLTYARFGNLRKAVSKSQAALRIFDKLEHPLASVVRVRLNNWQQT